MDVADLRSLWFQDRGTAGGQAGEARSESQETEKKIQSPKRPCGLKPWSVWEQQSSQQTGGEEMSAQSLNLPA